MYSCLVQPCSEHACTEHTLRAAVHLSSNLAKRRTTYWDDKLFVRTQAGRTHVQLGDSGAGHPPASTLGKFQLGVTSWFAIPLKAQRVFNLEFRRRAYMLHMLRRGSTSVILQLYRIVFTVWVRAPIDEDAF